MSSVGDILYRANVTWYYLGQNCQNSFFFRSKEGAVYTDIPAEMNALNNQLGAFLWPPLRNMMSNQCQLVGHTLVNLNGPAAYEIVQTFVGVFGNVASAGLPSFCASLIGWYTAFRGRRNHGRTYIPALPIAMVDGNNLTGTGLSTLESTANTILNNFSHDAGYSYPYLVCYSRANGNGTTSTFPVATTYNSEAGVPVTRHVLDEFVCTQRHRFEGRGI